LNDLLYTIAAQLRHLTPGEIVTLVCDFVGGLDEKQRTRLAD